LLLLAAVVLTAGAAFVEYPPSGPYFVPVDPNQ
jgi:hypothetical protein